MSHRDRTGNFGVGIKGTGEAKDLADRERKVRSDLKALLGQIRHAAVADLSLARKVPCTFDRDSILLAMLAHWQVSMRGFKKVEGPCVPERSVRGMRWDVITASVRRSGGVTICGAHLRLSPRHCSSR